MKFQIHVEWLEELDAKGERLGKEMKQLVEELEEIGKMKMVLEENGDLDDDEVVVHQPACSCQVASSGGGPWNG